VTDDPKHDEVALSDLDDGLLSGAADNSAASEEELARLPRILRLAVLDARSSRATHLRLAAEIDSACPGLSVHRAWTERPDIATGSDLAAELDRRAVAEDRTELRSLADCVLLLSIAFPRDIGRVHDHRRVAKSLLSAFGKLSAVVGDELAGETEALVFGWAALPACSGMVRPAFVTSAVSAAALLGAQMAKRRIQAAEAEAVARSAVEEAEEDMDFNDPLASRRNPKGPADPSGEDKVVVVRLDMKNSRLKEVMRPYESAINVALPLVKLPPLQHVREPLLREFPHAAEAIDTALIDLVSRTTLKFPALLCVGPPGGGKSRFARRIGELLNVYVGRTDGSGADGSAFGGTDRRWATSEPCLPFVTIARAHHANPIVLIDEIDKAATRRDYGRLWDSLLGFLERETALRYPDPCLRTTIDLGHVSYIATANSTKELPAQLLDRFRVLRFPLPQQEDLEALLPAVIGDLARERGLDPRWIGSLSSTETNAIAVNWGGGSIRRLKRIVELVVRERDARAIRH
jgi:hypothetical protein